MREYLEELEQQNKLDDYLIMLDNVSEKERIRQERIDFLFPMVRSALTGNGKLLVNTLLRKYRNNYFFEQYRDKDWNRLYKRITLSLLNYYDEINFNKNVQMWVNWKVLSYVQDLCRKWSGRYNTKIKCDVDQRANDDVEISSSDVIEELFDEHQLTPEQIVIIKDEIEQIDKKIKGDAIVYLDVYLGHKFKKDVCEELEISFPTFAKRYNKFKELLDSVKNS